MPTVTSIRYVRTDYHYDLHVPVFENYSVAGGFHHNSGKTEIGAMIAVATALGRRSPIAQAWAQAVGFPLDRLPDRPGRVLASALTSNDSKRVLRSQSAGKLPKYLPAGSVWKNQTGDGEAQVELPGGGIIVFKSNDQGRRAYQGDWFDLVWLDEEHDQEVFEECEMRVARVPGGGGWILLTMTPLKGYTWVYDRFVKEPRPTDRFHYLDGLENPWIPLGKTKRVLAGLSPARRAARRYGHFTALEGLVYDDFNREISTLTDETGLPVHPPRTNVCEPFEIPKEWRRYRAIDFGVRDAWVCLWIAIDPRDDVAYVYRELYDTTGRGTRKNGAIVAQWSRNEPEPEWTVADAASTEGRIILRDEHEIVTVKSIKGIAEGIAEVGGRIKPVGEGAESRVHLVFFTNCRNAIREHEQWKWRKDTGGANGTPQLPEDRDNHSCDAIIYWSLMYRREQSMSLTGDE